MQLQGSAYDLEDGTLGDAAFDWSSSIDGVLGTGASLNTAELTTGHHVITLVATDSDGMSTQVQVPIDVVQEDTPEALNLDVAPFGLGLVTPFRGDPFQTSLTLNSSGDTELNWTASEDVPWLSLDTSTGQTPANLTLTIDPSQLTVGTFYGKITLTSATAGNSPIEVNITLQVTGRAVYLPLLPR